MTSLNLSYLPEGPVSKCSHAALELLRVDLEGWGRHDAVPGAEGMFQTCLLGSSL